MATLTDPGLSESFQELTSESSDVNWILWKVEGKNDIVPAASGNGGLAELRGALDDASVMFGAFLIKGVDNRESTTSVRYKYINFSYKGPSAGGLMKARVSTWRDGVFQLMQGCAGTIDADEPEDLSYEEVTGILLKAGGAHKPTHYDFGDGETRQVDGFHEG